MKRRVLIVWFAALASVGAERARSSSIEFELKALELELFGHTTEANACYLKTSRTREESSVLASKSQFACDRGSLEKATGQLNVRRLVTLGPGDGMVQAHSKSEPLSADILSASYQEDSVKLSIVDKNGNELPAMNVSANSPFSITLGDGTWLACGPEERIDLRLESLDALARAESQRVVANEKLPAKSPSKPRRKRIEKPNLESEEIASERPLLPAPLINGEPYDPNFASPF